MSKQQLEFQETMPLPDINRKYTFVLSQKNEKRGRVYDDRGMPLPDPEFPPRRTLLLRSSIVWPAGKDGKDLKDPFDSNKTRKPGRYLIRYYDGCSTLFMDDQPKDKESVDQLVKSTREMTFINGYVHVYGYDTMLMTYMRWASWNEESPYRVPSIDIVFKELDVEKESVNESKNLDNIEKAMELAGKSTDKYMLMHARFIDVAVVDYRTGQELAAKAIRTAYRKAALDNPERFIDTYNDKTIEIKYYIEKALESGVLSSKLIPGKVTWGDKGQVICDISGITDYQNILNKLIELSVSEEGLEFVDQLKALYK